LKNHNSFSFSPIISDFSMSRALLQTLAASPESIMMIGQNIDLQ